MITPALVKPARLYFNLESLITYCREVYDLPVSKISVYRAVKAKKLNPIKSNGRLLFKITDVQKWIEGDAFSADEKAEG